MQESCEMFDIWHIYIFWVLCSLVSQGIAAGAINLQRRMTPHGNIIKLAMVTMPMLLFYISSNGSNDFIISCCFVIVTVRMIFLGKNWMFQTKAKCNEVKIDVFKTICYYVVVVVSAAVVCCFCCYCCYWCLSWVALCYFWCLQLVELKYFSKQWLYQCS